MDNNELISQIAALIEQSEKRTTQNIADVKSEITSLKLTIENDVTKRIDSLFDGYKLAHEKQWELERKIQKLEERLERLEARAV